MSNHRMTVAVLCLFLSPALFADWTTSTAGQVTTTDKVGVGTHTPGSDAGLSTTQEAPLHILSTENKNTILLIQNMTNDSNVAPTVRTKADVASQNFQSHASGRTISRFGVTLGGWNEFLAVGGNGLILGTLTNVPLILGTNTTNRMQIAGSGEVGIGVAPETGVKLKVAGNAHFDGTVTGTYIKAHYQDVAEWVPSNTDLMPGTVVVLDASIGNGVMASNRPYDTSVAGVVSEQPGIILGFEGTSKEQIATTGRVRVKVDASGGAIAVGDLLVTSDKAGYAMRSTPLEIGGASLHRPGTIVGKALEPLKTGQGEILVLLSLQ
jgi:hypothetical protein